MAEADKRSDQDKLLDDICPIHQTPMVKIQQHVGGGQTEWSAPSCALCDQLKRDGKYEAVAAAVADAAKVKAAPAVKEQAAPIAVKPDAAAPAAKT